ncbi:amidohydrolase family protein, partial [Phyllobacterium sp. P5_D12]
MLVGVTGCATPRPIRPLPKNASIDAHCHLFNASDLAVTHFIRYVFLKNYPQQSEQKLLGVKDRDIVDGVIELLIMILGANNAPTAKQELVVLKGLKNPKPSNASEQAASEIAVTQIAKFISKHALNASIKSARSSDLSGSELLVTRILEAGGSSPNELRAFSSGQAKIAAARAFISFEEIGVYLRWFNLFTLYRYVLLEKLIKATRKQGPQPALLAPALVDMDKWLEESAKSPLIDQMEVMGFVFQRRESPAVHGYFPFDPLREIYFRQKKGPEVSSLRMCKDALLNHGFIGAKVYPPMGFRASKNSGTYPDKIHKDLSGNLSTLLDGVLDEFYALCVDLDAPILTHAYASNAANKDYGMRADPAFWSPVFQKHRKLRGCLGHFGSFDLISASAHSQTLPEASWEWTFGRDIVRLPNNRIFADMSYFSEVLTLKTAERDALAATFRRWVETFDPGIERLVFGTDWLMLGKERDFGNYIPEVDYFLQHDCGVSAEGRRRFFFENAINFLGLERGGGTRKRVLSFYAAN